MTVTRMGERNIGELMEELRQKLGAQVVLLAVYLKNGKLSAVTYPGMDRESADRCVTAVTEELGDIVLIDDGARPTG